MSAHPAFPTARDLRIEVAAQHIVAVDLQAAQQIREALTTAIEKVKGVKYITSSALGGQDTEEFLMLLTYLMPPSDDKLRSQIEDAAYEIARDAEADRDRDAAEYRAELAREDVR